MKTPLDRAELAKQLDLQEGTVLELVGDADDPEPWVFLLLDLLYESGRVRLLRLYCGSFDHRSGTTTSEDMDGMLDDLRSINLSVTGIRWRKP